MLDKRFRFCPVQNERKSIAPCLFFEFVRRLQRLGQLRHIKYTSSTCAYTINRLTFQLWKVVWFNNFAAVHAEQRCGVGWVYVDCHGPIFLHLCLYRSMTENILSIFFMPRGPLLFVDVPHEYTVPSISIFRVESTICLLLIRLSRAVRWWGRISRSVNCYQLLS